MDEDTVEKKLALGWQIAAKAADIPSGAPAEVVIGDVVILVLRKDTAGSFIAVQGMCPHGWARLAEGTVQDGWLHCPRHMAKFQLVDGECGPGWVLPPLRRYSTRVIGEYVLVPDPLKHLD